MSKIATYSLADTPLQLSDRLIGTEAPRPTPSATPLATKNFSLGELLQLFSSEFPAPGLQGVLNTNNTATQNINLTGTITSTSIKPTNIVDMLNSEGTPLQVLSKGVGGICWIDAPSGGSAIWGDITGTVTNQTDLIDYLDLNYYPLSSNPAGYIAQQSVLEYPTFVDFPATGVSNTIYIAADTRVGYYWDGTAYVVLTSSTSGISGFGAVDYIAKFTPNGSTIGSSGIIESNGRVAINYSFRPLISGGTIFSIQRAQSQIDFILGNPGTGPSSSASFMLSDNEINGFEIGSKGEFAIKTGSTYSNEGIRVFSSGKLKFTQTPDTGSTSDFILLRDASGNVKQIAYPSIPTFTPSALTKTDDTNVTLTLGGTPATSLLQSVSLTLGWTGTLADSRISSASNWNTAYNDRLKWDGGATGLVAATGRTSLGATTVGSNLFTLTNPSSITFIRVNADNSISTLDASSFRTAIGAGTVTSVAAITLGTSGTDLSSTVANGTTAPVITLNVPTASAANRGVLSSTDWSTFNGKQNATSSAILSTLGWYNYKNTTASSTLIGTLSETQLLQVTIPANTFSATDFLKIPMALFVKTSGVSPAAVTLRLKISTSATMPSGATGTIAQFSMGAANTYAFMDRQFTMDSGNIVGYPFTTSALTDRTNGATITLSSAAFDRTVTQYFYVSAALLSITDSIFLRSIQITNV